MDFEPIIEPELKVGLNFSTFLVFKQTESLSDFICLVQEGKNLEELFLNIEEKQKKLIQIVFDCVVCLSFLLSDTTNRMRFLSSAYTRDLSEIKDISQIISLMVNGIIVSSRLFESSTELIDYINKFCEYFKIYESGPKTIKRAAEKTMAKLKCDPALLNDTIRITISPLLPEYFDYIVDYLSKTGRTFFKYKNWTISPSGVLCNSCYINIDGNVGQIAIDEIMQRKINITCSHEIYEVMRLMESENFQFSTIHIDENTCKKIKKGYNFIMEKYGQTTDIKFSKIEEDASFRVDQLHLRYKELRLLHQNIHIDAICGTDERWQRLYCSLMMEMNYKNKAQGEEEAFPEFLLEKIPKYKAIYKFGFARERRGFILSK